MGYLLIKINFNTAYKGRDRRLGSGIVIRKANGQILGLKTAINANIPSPFTAKALACVQSLQWGRELGFANVIVEGDSLFVIKKIKGDCADKSLIGV